MPGRDQARAIAERDVEDLRRAVGLSDHLHDVDDAAAFVASVLRVAAALRALEEPVPRDVEAAERTLIAAIGAAYVSLRTTPRAPSPEAEAQLVDVVASIRSRSTDAAAPIEVADVSAPLVAAACAIASGVRLEHVAPDVAADRAALEAAVQANRSRRRLDALTDDGSRA